MPTLCLLRHAKAAQATFGQEDFDRPLTERGRRDAEAMGPLVTALRPSLALVSPAVRTRETWGIAGRDLSPAPAIANERSLYLCRAEALVERLTEIPDTVETVIVVGHNPCLQEVALWLSQNGTGAATAELRSKFPTAAFASFAVEPGWAKLSPKRARLDRFVTPKELE
jgi:phosphohistidine phosphatase